MKMFPNRRAGRPKPSLEGIDEDESVSNGYFLGDAQLQLEEAILLFKKRRIGTWKKCCIVQDRAEERSLSLRRSKSLKPPYNSGVIFPLHLPSDASWIVRNVENNSVCFDIEFSASVASLNDTRSAVSTHSASIDGLIGLDSSSSKKQILHFKCTPIGKQKSFWLKHLAEINRLSLTSESAALGAGRSSTAKRAKSFYRKLYAHDEVEVLSRKHGKQRFDDVRFKVLPNYAYPNTKLNREELRKEMVMPSSQFHDLRLSSKLGQEIGLLQVEVLQCFGLPKLDAIGESDTHAILVCGSYAFDTDIIPAVPNPMWLSKMRRACSFPVFHAYASLYVGVFDDDGPKRKDDFAGRIVVELSRLRPGYFAAVTLQCCDEKSFQNIATTVHGSDMAGKFVFKQMKATIRELNFTRITFFRIILENQMKDTMLWKTPSISLFVFFAWMHCVYKKTIAFVPGHILTFLLIHLWKNYARFGIDNESNQGFLPPTWEEMFLAIWQGVPGHSPPCIEPLDLKNGGLSQQSSVSQQLDGSNDKLNGPSLETIARGFKSGVRVKTRRHNLIPYKDVFLGSEAVDFLISSGYAISRHDAVKIGKELSENLKLFHHVWWEHPFEDSHLFYCFSVENDQKYLVRTHKPRFKSIFQFLGFPIHKENDHLEFPFANGVDYPKFSVKNSLVTRRKNKFDEHFEDEDEDDDSDDDHSEEFLESETMTSIPQNEVHVKLEAQRKRNYIVDDTEDNFYFEVKPDPKPPPPQDIKVEGKDPTSLKDDFEKVRNELHMDTCHLFNDKVYEKNAYHIRTRRRLSSNKSKGIEDYERDIERILGTGQFSSGIAAFSKVGQIVEPIIGTFTTILSIFRVAFNVFTWRDPMLTFWLSLIVPVLIVILHLFPWRWFGFLIGCILFGPQNWLVKLYKERRGNSTANNAETRKMVRHSYGKGHTEDQPSFFSHGNQERQPKKVHPADVNHVRVPYSPLTYQRFYDWPPEPQYARVKADEEFDMEHSPTNFTYRRNSLRQFKR